MFKFRKGRAYYILYDDGEIWNVNTDQEKVKLVYYFEGSAIFTPDGKPSALKAVTQDRLLAEYNEFRTDYDDTDEAPPGIFDENGDDEDEDLEEPYEEPDADEDENLEDPEEEEPSKPERSELAEKAIALKKLYDKSPPLNKKETNAFKRKVRALSKRTLETDTLAVTALDLLATRLGINISFIDDLRSEDEEEPPGLFEEDTMDLDDMLSEELEEVDETGIDMKDADLDFSKLSITEMSRTQYLVNFKSRMFMVNKIKPKNVSWVIEEHKGGKANRIQGTYDTKEQAFSYLQSFVIGEAENKAFKNSLKGGMAKRRFVLRENDKVVYNHKGKMFLGVLLEPEMDPYDSSYIFKLNLFNGDVVTVNENSIDIVCKAKEDAVEKQAISRKHLDKYRLVEKKDRAYTCNITADEKFLSSLVDTEVANTDIFDYFRKQYDVFCKRLKGLITQPFVYRFVKEYILTHTLVLANKPNIQGSFKAFGDEVMLNIKPFANLKDGETARNLARTLVHEVVHYKLWPVENSLRKWCVKNVGNYVSMPENAKKKWLKRYSSKSYRDRWDVSDVNYLLNEANIMGFEELYGLTIWDETGPQLVSNQAIGVQLNFTHAADFDKGDLTQDFIKRFRRQLEK